MSVPPPPADADVAQVGDLGVEQLAVVVGQRQRPRALADAVGGRAHLLVPGVVGAHQARDLVAERDGDRAGERRDVDDRVGLLLAREAERVGEDEPAFGVGVEHLDRLAVAHPQHVAGSHRVAARHVLDERHEADHARLHAEVAQRRHRRDHRGRARHVGLHRLHAAGGLERQAAGVEHHALADERERGLRAARLVREAQEPRRALGADADADHAAEPLPLELLARSTRARSGRWRGRAHGASFTTVSGDFASGRLVHEVARPRAPPRATRAPRASPSRTFALARPSTCTRASFVGFASDLYVRNW